MSDIIPPLRSAVDLASELVNVKAENLKLREAEIRLLLAKVERLEKALKHIEDYDHVEGCYVCNIGDNGYCCGQKWASAALQGEGEKA